jgi:hypothetical protein
MRGVGSGNFRNIVILIVIFALTSGCIQNPLVAMQKVPVELPTTTRTIPPTHTIPPTRIPTPTPEPTTVIPTPVPNEIYNPDDDRVTDAEDEVWMDNETIIIPPAESNISLINFTTFRNDDFLIEYPDTWTVQNSTSTRVNNRIWSTPEILKEEVRHVTLLSEDRNTSMNITVYDFITPAGDHKISQNVQSVKDKITAEYPGVDGYKVVSGYKYFISDQKIMTVSYDLIFPEYSEWYPLAYTEQTFVTYSHLFVFDFISETGDLAKYNDLRYRMFSSIRTEGIMKGQGLIR